MVLLTEYISRNINSVFRELVNPTKEEITQNGEVYLSLVLFVYVFVLEFLGERRRRGYAIFHGSL
jgi:hypothetical protein